MIARLIAIFVIGAIGAFFLGLGIFCLLEGYGGDCVEFILWGTIALITAIALWKKLA